MGSGHILVYMFEVLREIYIKQGYTNREIPRLIIENNLYGLDIDERAYQLAAFSVVMKGMKFNNGLLRDVKRNGLKLNLVAIEETNDFTKEDIQFLAGENAGKNYERMNAFIKQFEHAKEIGSLLIIEDFDKGFLLEKLEKIKSSELNLLEIGIYDKVINRFETIIQQAKILSETYDIYVTNPPYLGRRYQTSATKIYLEENYDDLKSDLFSSFIGSSLKLTKKNGHIGFMSPFVWMFISSHEKLRNNIIANSTISSLIQLEYSGFEGATVPICTFTLRNDIKEIPGEYIRLSDFVGAKQQPIKTKEAIENPNVKYRYNFNQNNFKEIPGNPIAYWSSKQLIDSFNVGEVIKEKGDTRQGMATSDNNRFLRLWFEVQDEHTGFNYSNAIDAKNSGKKWFPYNKGGAFKKWYGNRDYLINYKNDGEEVKELAASKYKSFTRTIKSISEYFKSSISWSKISSGSIAFRYYPEGHIFDVAGCSIFFKNEEDKIYSLGFLNSKVVYQILEILSPTLNYEAGDIAKLPIIYDQTHFKDVTFLVEENIKISENDWDSYEISWGFKDSPLNKFKKKSSLIETNYKEWVRETDLRFNQLKENEEKLNNIFIKIYNLQDELASKVSDRDITITKIYDESADIPTEIKGNKYVLTKQDVIQQFISYTVGCMFGRYSLDEEGLIYAGGEFDASRYETYDVVEDNIIPITSDVYLENDLVNRFINFVETVYGKETLEENLDFIAEALGQKKNETSRETILNYSLQIKSV